MKKGRYLVKVDQYREHSGPDETWIRVVCDDCPGVIVKVVRSKLLPPLDDLNEAAEAHDLMVHAEELTLQESLE